MDLSQFFNSLHLQLVADSASTSLFHPFTIPSSKLNGESNMDTRAHNREAWNREVEGGNNRWTQPVSHEVIEKARQGEFGILLTENIPVPRRWFPPLKGADVLCLASGGGQQGPILAAVGANVTVFDNSPAQLKQDQLVAERETLSLKTVEGDAADLSMFADVSFDLVFNPVSTVFMQDVRAVWREAHRVLRHGGILMTGSMNPIHYIFDLYKADEGVLEIAHSIPYSDLTSIPKEDLDELIEKRVPIEFGHSLTDLLGGQCDAGFVITDLYEDYMLESPLHKYHPSYIATRAVKP
jgi:SAM-dependent methyltransferase